MRQCTKTNRDEIKSVLYICTVSAGLMWGVVSFPLLLKRKILIFNSNLNNELFLCVTYNYLLNVSDEKLRNFRLYS
jgi:hypothetical protein